MQTFLQLSRIIDTATTWIGRSVAWLIVVAVLVSAGNAVIRKAVGLSSNAWLELQWYLYGAVFMLAAAWTLKKDEHVRIDVLTTQLSHRTRDWIDLICHILFLMPFALLMIWLSWPFFLNSWQSGEMSMNAGGLIIWPAKLLILIGFILFAAQGVSEIIKKIAILHGDVAEPEETAEDHLPPELREHAHMVHDLEKHDLDGAQSRGRDDA
jgi:TRAP-type mannitol/chloroaromatic compound transport system permease small subunit